MKFSQTLWFTLKLYHETFAYQKLLPIHTLQYVSISVYRVVGKFGGGKVWRIDSFRTFGKRKFGELIDQPIDY